MNVSMWEAITYVTSGVTLAAFFGAAAAWVYRYKLGQQEKLIRTAPEAERAALVSRALELFAINTEKLTRDHQFELALQQIHARASRFCITAIVVTIIALLAAFVVGFAIYRGQAPQEAPTTSQAPLDDIDISDLVFMDYEGDSRAPRLDIKLTNRGTRSAFVKRVKINVKRTWRLVELPLPIGVVVPPEHNYVVNLKPINEPYQEVFPVSHGLKPDDFGRFTIQLEEDPWPSSNTIYLADVEILANSNDVTYQSKDLLFVITQFGTSFPDEKALQEMIRAQKSLGREVNLEELKKAIATNKAIIMEVSKVNGIKNRGLEHLIETAKTTNVGCDSGAPRSAGGDALLQSAPRPAGGREDQLVAIEAARAGRGARTRAVLESRAAAAFRGEL